jgi:hypothetical protein
MELDTLGKIVRPRQPSCSASWWARNEPDIEVDLPTTTGPGPITASLTLNGTDADECCEPAHRILTAVDLARGDRGATARALAKCDTMLQNLGVQPDPRTAMLRR